MKKGVILKSAFYDYKIIEQIGSGGNGIVYKVKSNDNYFAAKIIEKSKTSNIKIKRFKQEIYFCLKREHENIIKVLDYGLHNDNGNEYIFYIMPYYDSNLRKLINYKIDHDKIIPLFIQITKGLKYAHTLKVIHRDIKPENILYDTGTDTLVIADFGIAHFNQESLLTVIETKQNDRMANFKYCAPEQKVKDGKISIATDIFALGLILNEMFTGNVPHGTNYEMIKNVNNEYSFLDDIVELLIQNNPMQRLKPIDKIHLEIITRLEKKQVDDEYKKIIERKIDENGQNDPLLIDPPKLIGAQIGVNYLVLSLSREINPTWVEWFLNPGDYTFVMGFQANHFEAVGSEIKIRLGGHEKDSNLVEKLTQNVKEWIPLINKRYKESLEARNKARFEEEKQKRLKEIEEIERKIEIDKKLSRLFD